jgi:6-pyruvoyltetrahydropterin/6-carboxytetrahydropterin synthase
MSFVSLNHYVQVAHRLSLLPGKCEQIHGHSMKVNLDVKGRIGATGIMENLSGEAFEFGHMKLAFRDHLDTTYDHRLLLNREDPWAQVFDLYDVVADDPVNGKSLPGLQTCDGDPTTENIARWIADWACGHFRTDVVVWVEETCTNGVKVFAHFNPVTEEVQSA